MVMSEITIYNVVQSGMQQAKTLGFILTWRTDGWQLEHTKLRVIAQGETAVELLHYINGFRDAQGARLIKKAKSATKRTKKAKK